MRIKSYFDSSIQTAMRQAREEFGEDVMLITSRVASPDLRHLGDYEVVCAGENGNAAPKEENPPEPTPEGFEQMYRRQIALGEPHNDGGREAGIAVLQSSLTEIGLDPALADALVALVRSCAPLHSGKLASPFLISPPEYATDSPAAVISDVPVRAVEAGENLIAGTTVESGRRQPGTQTIVRNTDPSRSCEPARRVRRSIGIRRTPAKSGFMMMLIALGLYGMTRRSGA